MAGHNYIVSHIEQCDLVQELVIVSALDGRCVHFESPVLDVSKWLFTLLCGSFLNNFLS